MSETEPPALKGQPCPTTYQPRALFSTPSKEQSFHSTEKDVHVHIVDSGVNQIPTFHNRLILEADYTGRGHEDILGHGTSIASLIGSDRFGLAKQAILHSYKVDDTTGKPNPQNTCRAVLDAIKVHKRLRRTSESYRGSVLNLSIDVRLQAEYIWTEDNRSETRVSFRDLLERAERAGMTIVAAAGNDKWRLDDGLGTGSVCTATDAIISVGAVDQKYSIAIYGDQSGSNWSEHLTVYAKGKDVSRYDAAGKGTHQLNGTSFACAYVSGMVACILAREQDCSPLRAKQLLILSARRDLINSWLPVKGPNLVVEA